MPHAHAALVIENKRALVAAKYTPFKMGDIFLFHCANTVEFSIKPIFDLICSGNFDCWEEGENHNVRGCRGISAWIEMRGGKGRDVWRSEEGESEEVFEVTVEGPQRYQLCFESSKLDPQDKAEEDDDSVPFSLHLGFNFRVSTAQRSLPDEELGPDAMRAIELLEAATSTERQWQNLLDHFDFLRNREAYHLQLTGQINDRVMGWTIVEAVLVVSMAVAQVMYWKTFFEQRRYL